MPRFKSIYSFALCLSLVPHAITFAQKDQKTIRQLIVRERLSDIADQIPANIRKVEDPTVRVFLQLRVATLLWSERDENFTAQAKALTIAALADLDSQRDLVPKLYADLFRRDLLALLEANAPDLAKRYARDSDVGGITLAYSTLNVKGQEGLAIELLNRELGNGLVLDSTITFFLYRLEKQNPMMLPEALSVLLSAEERRVGTIPVQVLFWLVDLYLRPSNQPEIKRRFLSAAVLATAGSYTLSDANQVEQSYNLLQAILPEVKSLLPSLYPQAAGQLTSLMSRVSSTRSEREKIAERIAGSEDPLSQTISEARSANDPNLKDELFLEASQLAMKQGKLRLSFELAMSVLSDSRKKWREQVLSQIVDTAIAKKDGDLAGTIIARIESPLTRVAALQRLSLHYLESKEIWKAREVLNDALKSIKSLEDKTEQALALLRLLPVFLKVDEAMVPALVEQTLKSINNIPTPDDKTDKKIIGEYVKKTLAPLSWQVLPTFELLAEWDEIATSGLVDQIQLREIRTSALLGVAKAKLTTAKRTAAVDKLRKTRAQSTQHN